MKLKDNFIVHNMESESLLVPTGDAAFSGIVKGNRTMGAIAELLKTETTETAVIDAMCARFDGDRDAIARDVGKVLENLRDIGALDE